MTGVALIQSALLSRVNLWGARLDLILLVVLVWTVEGGLDEQLVWGFVGGLIVDLLSGGPLGATALALVSVAFVVGQPWGRGLGSPTARLVLLAFLGAALYHLILLTILASTGHTVNWGFALTQVAGPSAVVTMLLALLVRQPLAWLERNTRREGLTL